MQSFQLPPVYPITGSLPGLNHAELAKTLLQAGARFFQVRAKTLPDSEFYEQLLQVERFCGMSHARFLVNDRVDLALASKAHGVHLGQTDLPVAAARELLGTDAILGLSTHSRAQFERALKEDIDYLALGPIFSTTSKNSPYPPLGTDLLRQIVSSSPVPVVAIGGITLETTPEVWESGAASVAVISDILHAQRPSDRLAQYLELARTHFR